MISQWSREEIYRQLDKAAQGDHRALGPTISALELTPAGFSLLKAEWEALQTASVTLASSDQSGQRWVVRDRASKVSIGRITRAVGKETYAATADRIHTQYFSDRNFATLYLLELHKHEKNQIAKYQQMALSRFEGNCSSRWAS